jgi:regulator of sirC expression with transglutaminase-like and TPR domain
MNGQQAALLKLLSDDDDGTVRLVKEQLVRAGSGVLPDLEELLAADHPAATAHVRAVISEIHARAADVRLTGFLSEFGDSDRIEEACWLLAEAMLPGIETGHYRRLLDAWGATLADRTRELRAPADRIGAMRALLCAELGFRGNTRDYYNPGNSLLPSVIDTRLGIPISLCVLFMLVGERAGIAVRGVNLPGHFIARHDEVLFDPFHEARLMSATDCAEILAQQNQPLPVGQLDPVAPRLILLRMLTNLLYLFEQREDTASKQRVARWIRALEPRSPLGGRA